MSTREQAVARVREWLDVTRRFTDDCEVDGSWGAGLLMGDIRALVEPPSTPTDAELEQMAQDTRMATEGSEHWDDDVRIILAALKSVRDRSRA